MISTTHAMGIVTVIALVSFALRFVPFLVLGHRKTPAYVTYLGAVLPYAIMGLLLVYCLRSTTVLVSPHGIPEAIAVALTAGLQLWKKITLLSILCGTICYMFLVQVVF